MEEKMLEFEKRCKKDEKCLNLFYTFKGYAPSYVELRGNQKYDCSLCDQFITRAIYMQVTTLAMIGFPNMIPNTAINKTIGNCEMIWATFGFKLHVNLVSHFVWTTHSSMSAFSNFLHVVMYWCLFGLILNFVNNEFRFNFDNKA
jgi:hypothetical protein